MTIHRIDLRPPQKGHGKTFMTYRGQAIGASDSPIYAAARWLLGNGHAGPNDIVATYRGETLCMSGEAGELAKWTVQENDRTGLRLVRYAPWLWDVRPQTGESHVQATTPLPGPELAGSEPWGRQ